MKIWQKLTLAWGATASLLGIISILTIKIDTEIQSKTNEIVNGIVRENQAAGQMFVSIQSLQSLTENILLEHETDSLNNFKIKQYQTKIKINLKDLENNLIEAKDATLSQKEMINALKQTNYEDLKEEQAEIRNLNKLDRRVQIYKQEWNNFFEILAREGNKSARIASEEKIISIMNSAIAPLVSTYYEDSLEEIIESELVTQKLTSEHIKVIRNYAIFTFILSLILFIYLYYSIYIPIKILKRGTFQLGQNFSEYQPVRPQNPHDELGDLTKYFNETITTLKTKIVDKSYLDNIINSIGQGLIVIDLRNRIEIINYNISNLLGYSESELIGKPINCILARNNVLKIDELIKLDRLSSRCFSLELINKASQRITVIVYFSSLFDSTGQKKGTICLAMSVKNLSSIDIKVLQKSKDKANKLR